MKKIIVLAPVLLFAASAAFAARVSSATAEEFARNFLGSKSIEMVWDGAGLTKSALSEPAFYAFNRAGGGWVIVASDDCASPVLGYCDTGKIDLSKLPGNMKNFLRGMNDNIRKASSAGLQAAPKATAAWASRGFIRTKAATQTLLQTANWDQNTPYNQTVCANVKNSSGNSVTGLYTGCVATAMSIVLKYHQYPEKGKGTIPAYTTGSKKYSVPSVNIDGYTYNWTSMPNSKPTTTAQKTAVADLMFHCGAMVEMDYTTEGSGAYSDAIIPALTEYMSYSKAAKELYRYNYSDAQWFDLIKKDIDAHNPIIYGGADEKTDEGHQFIIDGYDSDNLVHINWGWSGDYNGWFAVSYLGDRKSGGVNGVFSYWDSGIFGLQPDPSGTAKEEIELYLDGYSGYKGLEVTSGTIAKNGDFSLKVGLIVNEKMAAYSGQIKAVLVGKGGTIKEDVCSPINISVKAASSSYSSTVYTTLSCSISKDIAFGDYIQIYYTTMNGDWVPMGGYNHKDSDSSYTGYTNDRISAVPGLSFILIPSELTAGMVIYPEFIRSDRLPSGLQWYWDGKAVDDGYVSLSAGVHSLKVVATYTDGTSETVTKKIQVN